MDINKLKFTKLQADIFTVLCKKVGHKLSQRDLATINQVSPTAISKSVQSLLKTDLIKKEQTNTTHYIELNRDNKHAIHLKRVDNLKQIYLSNLDEFLSDSLAGSTIILFGSFAKGEDTITSDIDIAVIGRQKKKIDVSTFETVLERPIRINFYDSFREIHEHLRNNILNGIVLHGTIEL